MSGIELVFTAALLAILAGIAVADFRSMIIPDWLNLLMAGLGLAYHVVVERTFPGAAIAFACVVFLAFWLVRVGYERMRGVAGLGFGDVKMAGGSALWFSPWNFPLFLFAASFSALLFVLTSRVAGNRPGPGGRIPFGPFIGIGLAVTWGLERLGWPTFIPYGDY